MLMRMTAERFSTTKEGRQELVADLQSGLRSPDKEKRLVAEKAAAQRFAEWSAFHRQDTWHAGTTRRALLNFIGWGAGWEQSTVAHFLDTSRTLTLAAHKALGGEPGTRQLVIDPFAGGGSIPLEALRVGADAVASDLNPIAVTINRVCSGDIPRFGTELVTQFRQAAERIRVRLQETTAHLFPAKGDEVPIGYLFGRTILSEAPSGQFPVEIPLIRSMWLAKRGSGGVCLKWVRDGAGQIVTDTVTVDGRQILRPRLEIADVTKGSGVTDKGTTIGGAATCPITGYTTPVESVRRQLLERHGGSDDARLLAVICDQGARKVYRAPATLDLDALSLARQTLESLEARNPGIIPKGRINHLRGFINIVLYGMSKWSDAFNSRQTIVMNYLCDEVAKMASDDADPSNGDLTAAVQRCLALAVDRLADYNSALCTWRADGEFVGHTFSQGQALPMRLDYVEINPLSGSTGDWSSATQWVLRVCEEVAAAHVRPGQALKASARSLPFPDDIADLVFTDPPYYAAVPYADLSDFFYIWLKRSLGSVDPDLFQGDLSPKDEELVSLAHRAAMYREKDGPWFQERMREACIEARRVAKPGSIAVWVFANKETAAWEAMLSALITAGWIIEASWPIDTEMEARLRARNSAVLASSVHIVCRPRENHRGGVVVDEIGDWRDVLLELPRRIEEWMPRLAEEGVVGADAIFACLGPALEIFSRYSRVEKASGEAVTFREYLEQVWAAVAKEALTLVFAGADASGFEEDARLTAMWLWTLYSAGETDEPGAGAGSDDESDEEEQPKKSSPTRGYVLEFDAARKIAQGLGAHLEDLAHLVEIKGDKATLLSAGARARYLFGKDTQEPTKPRTKKKAKQLALDFGQEMQALDDETGGEWTVGVGDRAGSTTLDQLHQSMILFGAGRGEALRRLLVEEGVGRNARFWALAQALGALYPHGTDERRWVEGVQARKKGLGL
jgi:adenine-specific DNA methylase